MTYIRDGRAPIPKKAVTSRVMSANKAKDTGPELALRKALRKVGLSGARYHQKNINGRPDIAFPKKRVAIFIHGCFWHRCPRCKMSLPKTHRKFWLQKFTRNKARDQRKTQELKRNGWRVLTLWECQIKKGAQRIAERAAKFVGGR